LFAVGAAMLDKPESDTRSRIVATAERFFREIGYQKTTVADIAKALKMSPANVYRFFDSKKAINEAVTELMTGQVRDHLRAIAAQSLPASTRLRQVLISSHQVMIDMGVSEAKMMEMVEVAMTESWSVIEAHIAEVDAIMAGVVADGVTSGEFRAMDPIVAGTCIRAAMIRFCHPSMIVQCATLPAPTLEQQVDFIMGALLV
jgi:AcrR family transcriptional regulator